MGEKERGAAKHRARERVLAGLSPEFGPRVMYGTKAVLAREEEEVGGYINAIWTEVVGPPGVD